MAFMLATRVLPPVVTIIPLYIMAQQTGTRDTLSVLVFVYTAINLPIAIWMLTPVFGPKATDQEEAAQLDGASHIFVFFQVVLPMVRTAMITVGLIVFLQCWNEYLLAVYLTGDHALTVPPWMVGQLSMKEAQIGGEADEWTHLSAATIVMALPPLLFTLFAQRSLGRSLALSASSKIRLGQQL
jgi:ABC-type glycerol-3-phosphate transport system permease component